MWLAIKILRFYALAAASYAAISTIALQFPIYDDPNVHHYVQWLVMWIAASAAIAVLLARILLSRITR